MRLEKVSGGFEDGQRLVLEIGLDITGTGQLCKEGIRWNSKRSGVGSKTLEPIADGSQ